MKKGFTLAKALIIISIAGIMAQIIIPILVKNAKQTVLKSQLEEGYEVLLVAGAAVKNKNGGTFKGLCSSDGTTTNVTANDCVVNAFKDRFKYTRECVSGATQGSGRCWPTNQFHYNETYNVMDYDLANRKALFLSNSMSFNGFYVNKDCTTTWAGHNIGVCGGINLDINGFDPPNMIGKDVHQFIITKDTILPLDTSNAYTVASGDQDCPGTKDIGCTPHRLN